MTKTFKISDITQTGIGDVELSDQGQPEVLENKDKLVQDILEILLVMEGQRDVPRTSPEYGSKIYKILGYPLPAGSLETLLRGAIDSAILKLKAMQGEKTNLSKEEHIFKTTSLQIKKEQDVLGYRFHLAVDTYHKRVVVIEGTLI